MSVLIDSSPLQSKRLCIEAGRGCDQAEAPNLQLQEADFLLAKPGLIGLGMSNFENVLMKKRFGILLVAVGWLLHLSMLEYMASAQQLLG